MVPNGELWLCQSGLELPTGPLAPGPAGSGQYRHLSSTERLIMAEQLLVFSILFLSCGAAQKLP